MRLAVKQLINWLLVGLWLAVIYYLSDQPNLSSGLQYSFDLVLRKLAHVTEFFVLAYFFNRALLGHKISTVKAVVGTIILTLVAASLDEWHQGFVTGRLRQFSDVLVDSLGLVVFIILDRLYGKNLSNK